MSKQYLEPPEWYASLPVVYVAACLLLTDPDDRVLLVKPGYRPDWGIPGGVVEEGETPHECAVREIAEELGIQAGAGRLLVLDWSPPLGERPRVMVSFMFDGGTVTDPAAIRLDPDEIEDAAFLPWEEARARLPAPVAARLPAAYQARRTQSTVYLPGQPALPLASPFLG
jgi:8-oxo-dGTP pyrophosphatase MutT (NUDIX family)